jgi:hypothetical protein
MTAMKPKSREAMVAVEGEAGVEERGKDVVRLGAQREDFVRWCDQAG